MILDTVDGVQERTIPQMGQQAGLLALVRNGLPAGGESALLIEHCVHAGCHILYGGHHHQYAQALMTLDRRWSDSGIAEDPGVEARSLYSMGFLAELSVDAYSTYFNQAVSRAGKIGQAPIDDSDGSMLIRQPWWHVLASPPVGSAYYQAATEARTVIRQENSTVAHRVAWCVPLCVAMLQAVTRMVDVGAVMQTSGLGKGGVAHARLGAIVPRESVKAIPV